MPSFKLRKIDLLLSLIFGTKLGKRVGNKIDEEGVFKYLVVV